MAEQQELVAIAESYHELGLPIIPFYINPQADAGVHDKKPRIDKYAQWQTEIQTDQEFKALDWRSSNGFGVILGIKATNGFYLSCIDFDTKNNKKTPEEREAYEQATVKGREILKKFPQATKIEKTVNDGIHLYYWSKERPDIDGSFHDIVALELLGYPKLCVMFPSYGYKNIGSDVIAEVENLDELFHTILAENGFKEEEEIRNQDLQDLTLFSIEKIVDLSKLESKGNGQYQGSHPIHDSTTESNFTVDTKRNVWHCFRHSSGGGVLQYLAMQEGIIKCEDAKKGALRGKKFRQVIQIAETQGWLKKGAIVFEKEESQADRMYKLFCENSNVELFHDQNKTEYARIPLDNKIYGTDAIDAISTSKNPLNIFEKSDERSGGDCKVCGNAEIASVPSVAMEIVKLSEKKFSDYLSHLLWEAEGKIANSDSKRQVISLLSYDASHGRYFKLYNRVAPDPSGDGSIWVDIADPLNRAYHITKDGWTIETNVPILFRRSEHQQPLAIAEKEGNVKLILPFVNIGASKQSETTKHRQLLMLIQTASYAIPEISHPINAMFGCPGSHKSWAQRFIQEIWDSSAVPYLRIPRDENAAIQVLDHHYIPIFDNLSYMPGWLSDMLCGAVTGAGQESRALYTNDDPFIRSFKRCVMLNGVNLQVTKGDLLSRSILHPTEPSEDILTDEELLTQYRKVLPYILGGFLNVISFALKLKGTKEAQPNKLFRLSDFTEWGCAIALALGEKKEDFIKAMDENLANQNNADIENNLVADSFLAYVQSDLTIMTATEEKPYKSTPSEIFAQVTTKAQSNGVNVKNSKRWPQAASLFTRKLNDSKNAIIANHWNYDIVPKGDKREMTIWNLKAIPQEVKHFCYKECGNYDSKEGQCPNYGNLNQTSEMPFDCQSRIPLKKAPKKKYVCDKCGMEYFKNTSDGQCNCSQEDGVCGGLLHEEAY